MAYLTFNPEQVTLVYEAENGDTYLQPLTDLVESGTAVDPETGDDMPIIEVRVEG